MRLHRWRQERPRERSQDGPRQRRRRSAIGLAAAASLIATFSGGLAARDAGAKPARASHTATATTPATTAPAPTTTAPRVASATPAPGLVPTEPGFVSEVVATMPPYAAVGIAFADDGRIFEWEKSGVVRTIRNGVSTAFLNIQGLVNTCSDRGLTGLALDPNFSSNGYVYLLYAAAGPAGPNDCGPSTSRLTRVRANPANPNVAMSGETVILDGIVAASAEHSTGSLRFGLDGKLFVSHGDGAFIGYADPFSLRAQSLDYATGKVLRINPDGTAPTDNPFYDGTNSVRSKVWSYGLRNPFRFDIHPVTGEPFIGDVGLLSWEEINTGRGANFGWPCFEGNAPNPSFQAAHAECRALLAAGTAKAPFYTYAHDPGGSAVIGGPVLTGTAYPEQYRGSYYFVDYVNGTLRRIEFNADGSIKAVLPFGRCVAGAVQLTQGPDGMLYCVSIGSGQITRLRYNTTSAPTARVGATPQAGGSPLTVNFRGSDSTAPTGTLTYSWDFGDGTSSTVADPVHVYTASTRTTFTATLTVTAANGQRATAYTSITVGNAAPVPVIAAPAAGDVNIGQTVTLRGSATDTEDGAISASALRWNVLLHHDQHIHPYLTIDGATGSFAIPSHGIGTFRYEVRLTATDSSGLSGTATVMLNATDTGQSDLVAAYSADETAGDVLHDVLGGGNDGARGAATWTPNGHFRGGLAFSATSAAPASVPSTAALAGLSTSEGTAELWVKPADVARRQTLLAKASGSADSDIEYAIEIGADGRPRCVLGDGSAAVSVSGLSSLTAGTDVHLACTWSAATLSLYVDSGLVATTPRTIASRATTAPLTFGGLASGERSFTGVLDEIRLHRRALDGPEIAFDRSNPIAGTTNTAPSIDRIGGRVVTSDTATTVPINVGDLETPATSLTVSASASAPGLLPASGIVVTGAGESRTLTLRPTAGDAGSASVTVTVSDGTLSTSTLFQVDVVSLRTLQLDRRTVRRGIGIAVSWADVPRASPTDRLVVFSEASGADVLTVYPNCSTTPGSARSSGSCTVTLPESAAAGDYRVRMYRSETTLPLAASSTFTLVDTATRPESGERLYADNLTPAELVAGGPANAVTTAQRVSMLCPAVITGVWWYRTADDTGLSTVIAWRGTTELARGTGFPSTVGFTYVAFDRPISTFTGDELTFGVHHPNGGFARNRDTFTQRSVSSANGCLRIPIATATDPAGRLGYGPSSVFPSIDAGGAEFFLSPVIAPPGATDRLIPPTGSGPGVGTGPRAPTPPVGAPSSPPGRVGAPIATRRGIDG